MDNRLDFIDKFKEGATEAMADLRKKYIALDDVLRELIKEHSSVQFARVVSIARTYLETSLQYGIKSLCLKHEDKG
jgi:hypothetical protein